MNRGALTCAIIAANGKLTAQEIADDYGTTYNSVQATIHRLRHYEGLTIKLPRQPMPRPTRDRVQELADGTRSIQEIADEIGISHTAVRSQLFMLREEGANVAINYGSWGKHVYQR
jgi:predicted ArsR family transcriptional regulator